MRSLAELEFALDALEIERGIKPVVAAPADYVPGANPNDLSEAELEQRRQAALKSAEARRKNGVADAMRIRNQAVADRALHRAQVDFFIHVAGENKKAQIRAQLRDPSLSPADRQALNVELKDVYETEKAYQAEVARDRVQRTQKIRYFQKQMQQAAARYDSAAWANAKSQLDALQAEADDEEVSKALYKEHDASRKRYLSEQEAHRRQVEKAEREHERQVRKFFAELERQKKKRQREAESARKKAEREAKKAAKEAGEDSDSPYAQAMKSERAKILNSYYGEGKWPTRLSEDFSKRKKKPKAKK